MIRSEQDLNQHITSLHPELIGNIDHISPFGMRPSDEEPMLKLDDEEEEELRI